MIEEGYAYVKLHGVVYKIALVDFKLHCTPASETVEIQGTVVDREYDFEDSSFRLTK